MYIPSLVHFYIAAPQSKPSIYLAPNSHMGPWFPMISHELEPWWQPWHRTHMSQMGWTSPRQKTRWSWCSGHLLPRGHPSLLRQWPPSDLRMKLGFFFTQGTFMRIGEVMGFPWTLLYIIFSARSWLPSSCNQAFWIIFPLLVKYTNTICLHLI